MRKKIFNLVFTVLIVAISVPIFAEIKMVKDATRTQYYDTGTKTRATHDLSKGYSAEKASESGKYKAYDDAEARKIFEKLKSAYERMNPEKRNQRAGV